MLVYSGQTNKTISAALGMPFFWQGLLGGQDWGTSITEVLK